MAYLNRYAKLNVSIKNYGGAWTLKRGHNTTYIT